MRTILRQFLALLFFITVSLCLKAQIGIGTNNPDTSAVLEIKSTKKGILLPRVDDAQSADRVKASILYDNATGKFKFYDGTQWLSVNPLNPDVNDNVTAPKDFTVAGNETIIGNETVTGALQVNGTSASLPNATSVNAPNATVTGNNFVGYGTIPIGGIIMWSGTVVPDGWALCNGATVNGYQTPDLRGRFVVGYVDNISSSTSDEKYNTSYVNDAVSLDYDAIGKPGGKSFETLQIDNLPSHNHTVIDNGHTHSITGQIMQKDGTSTKAVVALDTNGDPGHGDKTYNNKIVSATSNITLESTGDNQPFENRPPYYVLAFIMRVK
ncbi:MAG: tail fiber protein [Breznakibacter sp.]